MRFWGVRGSIAAPGPDTVKYGGNTPCVEIRCGDHVFVFDAGTGLRPLGKRLVADGVTDVDLFLSHTHMDHVVGFPFFTFSFQPENTLRVWSGHLDGDLTTERVLRQLMCAPLFPVPVDIFTASVGFRDFRAGDTLEPKPGVTMRTALLNHPQNATGYRVEYEGRSICYVTDTAHVEGKPDQTILGLIDGADIVIYDSTFTDAEFPTYRDWGHSTFEEGARLCAAAGVKTYAIFHHLPSRTDAALDTIEEEARKMHPGALVAREGLVLAP